MEELPEDLQKIVTEVSDEWIVKQGEAWDQADEAGKEFVTGLDKSFIELSEADNEALVKAMAPIYSEYTEATAEKGLPGEEFLADIQKMLK